jgi:hypothetical protein
MYPYDHVAKASRIERSLRKFDVEKDQEMIIECCMLAATHCYNAALHVEALSIPLIDQAHTFRPTLDMYSKKPSARLKEGMAPLKFIEQLRPKHCRGKAPVGRALIDECLQKYEKAKAIFLEIIGDNGKPEFWTEQ